MAIRNFVARVMRVFFYLLYHQFAWTYDGVAALVSFGKWKTWVLSVVDLIEDSPILELGYGPGHLQVALHGKGIPAFGIDASPQMARRAARTLRSYHAPVRLVNCTAQILPFPNEYFYHAIATFPSEYIFDPQTLAEIKRVINPGGSLIVLLATRITGRKLHHRLLARLYQVTGETPSKNADLTAPFQRAGFGAKLIEIPHKSGTLLLVIAEKVGKI